MVCSPFQHVCKKCGPPGGCLQRQMSNHMCGIMSQAPSSSRCLYISTGYPKPKYTDTSVANTNSYLSVFDFQAIQRSCFGSCIFKQRSNWHSLTVKNEINSRQHQKICIDFSFGCQNMNAKLVLPKQGINPKVKCNVGPLSWPHGCASTGLIFGLLVCNSTSEPEHAEAAQPEENKEELSVSYSHGKKVYTDYSIFGIAGDGRCLFRSIAHGACLRSGRSAPNERYQRELADDLRANVADEFIRRREETEWFIEGDFDTYLRQIRKPHVWGGEPELFMASHVLQMPITVYMNDLDSGGLISIAQYGQDYGKENPIRLLYHGFGHYDALQIPGKNGARSRP